MVIPNHPFLIPLTGCNGKMVGIKDPGANKHLAVGFDA
jgi:hypothetical protein